MDEPSKPRRGWFRFSLRSLFALVTALACILAYHLNWIRERHRLLDDWIVLGARDIGYGTVPAPGALSVFGESGYVRIEYLPDYVSDDDIAAFFVLRGQKPCRRLTPNEARHVQNSFPEAEVRSSTRARQSQFDPGQSHPRLDFANGPRPRPPHLVSKIGDPAMNPQQSKIVQAPP